MNKEVQRLRERHIAKLLDHLGGRIDDKTRQDIRRAFRWFSDDIEQNTQAGRAQEYEYQHKT